MEDHFLICEHYDASRDLPSPQGGLHVELARDLHGAVRGNVYNDVLNKTESVHITTSSMLVSKEEKKVKNVLHLAIPVPRPPPARRHLPHDDAKNGHGHIGDRWHRPRVASHSLDDQRINGR